MTRKTTEAKAVLRNYHALVERTYKGDTDAICALVDLETALGLAGLTERQAEALRLVYGEGHTLADAGKRMGITKQAVALLVDTAASNIDEIYESWAWKHGELTADGTELTA